MFLGVWSGLVGRSLSFLLRLELSSVSVVGGVTGQLYNIILTIHGLLMIFFMVIPIMVGGFGNYVIPLMVKICDMGFPRLNRLRF